MKENLEKKIEYYSNGNIEKKYYVNQKGQKHGSFKVYWLNGSIMHQQEYKNNKLYGLHKRKLNNNMFVDIDTKKENQIFGLMIEFENK